MLSAILHVAEGLEARAVRELLFERAEEAHAARQEAEDFLLGAVGLMLNSPDAFETALASHELSESLIGKRPSDVEPPPMTVAGVAKSVYSEEWQQAMREEFEGHLGTGTFSFVDGAPEGRRPVSLKWCFSWKPNKEGKIEKFKARLVARGFSQIPNVDYFHSSFPCSSSASIKLMLAVANEKGMNLNHWDVKQAYTHATLDEEVLLRLPAGCGDKSHKIVKAERAIYGLKQSGRQWGYHVADTLVENGFEQCKADPCVFRKMVNKVVVMISMIYVDDILVAGSDEDREELLASLNNKFPTKNLGECERFDGTVKCFDVRSTSRIPASPGVDLGSKRDDEKGGEWPVREAIGSMMWVSTFSRPDVSFAVRAVARHAHAPAKRHWDAIQKILGFLKGTRDLDITYQRGSGLGLAVYVDASYTHAPAKRHWDAIQKILGFLKGTRDLDITYQRGSGLGLAVIVSLSSTEAEYIAAGEGVKEALFVRAVLSFVAPEASGSSIQVLEDNQGAIALVQNPLSSGRTKHIDVRSHFIRGLFGSGDISVNFVPSTEQHADLLTKALGRASLQCHRRKLMKLPGLAANKADAAAASNAAKNNPPAQPGPEGTRGGEPPAAAQNGIEGLLWQIIAGQQRQQLQIAALQLQQHQQHQHHQLPPAAPLGGGVMPDQPAGGVQPLPPLAAAAAASQPNAPANGQGAGAKIIIEKRKTVYWNTTVEPMFFLLRSSEDIGPEMDEDRLALLTKQKAHITKQVAEEILSLKNCKIEHFFPSINREGCGTATNNYPQLKYTRFAPHATEARNALVDGVNNGIDEGFYNLGLQGCALNQRYPDGPPAVGSGDVVPTPTFRPLKNLTGQEHSSSLAQNSKHWVIPATASNKRKAAGCPANASGTKQSTSRLGSVRGGLCKCFWQAGVCRRADCPLAHINVRNYNTHPHRVTANLGQAKPTAAAIAVAPAAVAATAVPATPASTTTSTLSHPSADPAAPATGGCGSTPAGKRRQL
ncbi:unnamed protein product [Ectocarpus sp. CCAP 1310/34]|nr:unnamed protein product [Ectocarpus sp. CCAP 1310/34]